MNWAKTYTAQVLGRELRIARRDGKPVRTTWDVLQKIKNEMLGEDVRVVEVFPPEGDVVNEINVRHLFAVPEGLFPSGLHWPEEWDFEHGR